MGQGERGRGSCEYVYRASACDSKASDIARKSVGLSAKSGSGIFWQSQLVGNFCSRSSPKHTPYSLRNIVAAKRIASSQSYTPTKSVKNSAKRPKSWPKPQKSRSAVSYRTSSQCLTICTNPLQRCRCTLVLLDEPPLLPLTLTNPPSHRTQLGILPRPPDPRRSIPMPSLQKMPASSRSRRKAI